MSLIDLVALGTVADLVQLDFNNRLIVYYGLKKIRSDDCNLGIKKLFHLAKKDHHLCQSEDLSFLIAPKINAGRPNV
jgi:single-stranded-DNA-specific exonuclease